MKYNFKGLSDAEVKESRQLHGSNALSMVEGSSFWTKLLNNFKDPIIIILIVALVIILVFSFFDHSEWYEALAIAVAVLLAVLVSTFSEYKNESSFQKIQEEASQILCNVFRNGNISELLIGEIVTGDYVLLQSGDSVPADGVIVHGDLNVNQASLTGESDDVPKKATTPDYILSKEGFNDLYYLFRGSMVTDGEAVFVVKAVGDHSFYGQLSKELSLSSERQSPLQLKLEKLAKSISTFGYAGASLIVLSYMFNKVLLANNFSAELIATYFSNWSVFAEDLLNAFVLAIIIIVAAVPEGLPMMIALVLSLNMRKMLNEKVLVRKLLGIETAGSLDILFSDKTGTITTGKLDSRFMIGGNLNRYNSYQEIPDNLKTKVRHSILGNSFCVITPQGEPVGGNTSERALVNFIDLEERIHENVEYDIQNAIRFDSARKFSAQEIKANEYLAEIFGSRDITYYKGALDLSIENLKSYVDDGGEPKPMESFQKLLEQCDQYADEGVRLIAIAYSTSKISDDKTVPVNLVLIGVIGIHDEIRNESHEAVNKALTAGIQVVMITGDRKGTAESIAKEIGLITDEHDLLLTSEELNSYSDEELKQLLPHLKLVARALPTDKSRLVRLAKHEGRVVGMTGDGVNDSAALKQADVGFAMGSGSEIAKEAGEIVILDDNFSSITNAVKYGRTIFKSIRKFIVFQLTVNLAAVLTVFLAQFFGFDHPLTIIQLLWVNVIMDTLAALAIGGEPAVNETMKEQPVRRDQSIISNYMASAILWGGFYITLVSIGFLAIPQVKELFIRNGAPSYEVFLSAFFNVFVFLIVFNAFNARTPKINLLNNISKNKIFIQIMALIAVLQVTFTYLGGAILRTVALEPIEWFYVLVLSISIIPFDMLRKLIVRRRDSMRNTGI